MKKLMRYRGYTLVEILVVMAIIAVILGLSATTMKNLATAEGVKSGVPVMKAKFDEARQVAIGGARNVRLVIYADDDEALNEPDRFLRYVTIAEYVDNSGNPIQGDYTTAAGDWVERSKGEYLPKHCYFSIDLSQVNSAGHRNTSGADIEGDINDGLVEVGLLGDSGTRKCYFYEFNHLGFPVNPTTVLNSLGGGGTEAPRVILANGQLRRTSDGNDNSLTLGESSGGGRNYAGFLLGRHGGLVDITNLDEIKEDDQ